MQWMHPNVQIRGSYSAVKVISLIDNSWGGLWDRVHQVKPPPYRGRAYVTAAMISTAALGLDLMNKGNKAQCAAWVRLNSHFCCTSRDFSAKPNNSRGILWWPNTEPNTRSFELWIVTLSTDVKREQCKQCKITAGCLKLQFMDHYVNSG